MLKCKKVEKLFPLDQMVVKRLCNNVAENLKKFSRRDKCCPRDYAIIGKKKSFPAVTDGVTATMLKCGSNKKYFSLYQMVIQRQC